MCGSSRSQEELAGLLGGQPGVQMLPATWTCTGSSMILEAAFATAAVSLNESCRAATSEVTKGKAPPRWGISSTCQSDPPPLPPETSRMRIAENSENRISVRSFPLLVATMPRQPSKSTSSRIACLPAPSDVETGADGLIECFSTDEESGPVRLAQLKGFH
jgi:hypothetical protein